MARPQKNTVDFFPHYVKYGQTIPILEARWGNDGYAFWFKLLEVLGGTENHWLDMNKPIMREMLAAKTRLSVEICIQILDLLAELDAIDAELWTKHHVIWCQNLVDNVAVLYQKRKTDLPQRPNFDSDVSEPKTVHEKDFRTGNSSSTHVFEPKTQENIVVDIVDNSKVNNGQSGHNDTTTENFSAQNCGNNEFSGRKPQCNSSFRTENPTCTEVVGEKTPQSREEKSIGEYSKDSSLTSLQEVRSTSVQRTLKAWNSIGINPIKVINPGTNRYKLLKTRIREYGEDTVLEAIDRITKSSFLRGNNKRGWTITFDWFIKPNNFIKVLEGAYDDDVPGKRYPRFVDRKKQTLEAYLEEVLGEEVIDNAGI